MNLMSITNLLEGKNYRIEVPQFLPIIFCSASQKCNHAYYAFCCCCYSGYMSVVVEMVAPASDLWNHLILTLISGCYSHL